MKNAVHVRITFVRIPEKHGAKMRILIIFIGTCKEDQCLEGSLQVVYHFVTSAVQVQQKKDTWNEQLQITVEP